MPLRDCIVDTTRRQKIQTSRSHLIKNLILKECTNYRHPYSQNPIMSNYFNQGYKGFFFLQPLAVRGFPPQYDRTRSFQQIGIKKTQNMCWNHKTKFLENIYNK